jgi:hypothetical protein
MRANVAIAVVAAGVGYAFSQRAVFLLVPVFAVLAGMAVLSIPAKCDRCGGDRVPSSRLRHPVQIPAAGHLRPLRYAVSSCQCGTTATGGTEARRRISGWGDGHDVGLHRRRTGGDATAQLDIMPPARKPWNLDRFIQLSKVNRLSLLAPYSKFSEHNEHRHVGTHPGIYMRFPMNSTKWLLTASAVAFIAGTSITAAQQEPPGPAPAEKIAPKSNDGLNTPASPGVNTSGALHQGLGAEDRKNTKELSEGNRTGELQENRGRTDATGQASSRERNRVTSEKKSDRESPAPAARPK